jgi:hypothetical protein
MAMARRYHIVAVTWSVVAVTATLYFAFEYSGPFRWLAELQRRIFGSYHGSLTVLLTLGVFFGPWVLALRIARRFRRRGSYDPEAPVRDERLQSVWVQRVLRIQRPVFIAAVGGALIFIGVRDERSMQAGNEPRRVSCAALEATEIPNEGWLELSCTARWDAGIEAKHDYGDFLYVPLVSTRWTPGRPVAAVMRIDRSTVHSSGGPPYRGARLPYDLPGFVRERYAQAGFDVGHSLLLELGTSPGKTVARARVFQIVGPVLLLVGLIGVAVRWRASAV